LQVPFIDLNKRFNAYQQQILDKLIELGQNNDYILGKSVHEFEAKMAEFIGCKYVIGVNSGFDALFLSLMALGISSKDEVITVSNSYIATANAIKAVGATPVFVDVGADYNIAVDSIEKSITSNTKVIMPVHLTGNPCEMDKILKIARKHNLKIIEDAAQAVGAKYKNKNIGNWGDTSCFSMHPIKNLGLLGDGGFICTNSMSIQKKLLLLRNHGHKNRDEIIAVGFNSRLDTFQASVGLIFLNELKSWTERINQIADQYRSRIVGPLIHPVIKKDSYAVYQNYIIMVNERDELMKFLLDKGVETKVHYPIPIHKQEAYKDLDKSKQNLPETERQVTQILSLPIYPELTDEQVELTIVMINEFYKK
tara:strand:- start:13693 stop:14790 length:1098 start_codon:yes stop_codon:yes gene_type:complete